MKKRQFRVGDRVRAIDMVGELKVKDACGEIILIDTAGKPYLVEFDSDIGGHNGNTELINGKRGHCWWCTENELKLEEKKVFSKKDLKNGDVVMRRNGNLEVLILPNRVFLGKDGGWNDYDEIEEDLTTKCSNDEWDIIAVRRPKKKHECRFDIFKYNQGKQVYDRERDTTREMTVAEIEEALGYPVKVVK